MGAVSPAVVFREVSSGPLARVSFAVHPGEVLVISGPRGTGKHHLVRLVLGLDRPERGVVEILGADVGVLDRAELGALRSRCGFAPILGALIDNLTASDNVGLPLRYHGLMPEDAVKDRVTEALDALGVGELGGRRPAQLSSVEERLVALARVWAVRPRVALLEDPFEGMDDEGSDHVERLLVRLVALGCATLVTSHATRLATTHDGRLLRIPGGRVLALGATP